MQHYNTKCHRIQTTTLVFNMIPRFALHQPHSDEKVQSMLLKATVRTHASTIILYCCILFPPKVLFMPSFYVCAQYPTLKYKYCRTFLSLRERKNYATINNYLMFSWKTEKVPAHYGCSVFIIYRHSPLCTVVIVTILEQSRNVTDKSAGQLVQSQLAVVPRPWLRKSSSK